MNNSKFFNLNQINSKNAPSASGWTKGDSQGAGLGNATKLRTPPRKINNFYSANETGLIEIENHSSVEMIELIRVAGTALTPTESKNLATTMRFDLQDTARKTLYGYRKNVKVNEKGFEVHHRTCTCTRFLLGTDKLQIVHSKANQSASFKGVMACGNSKTCPVCSEVINQRKANEMRTAFNQVDSLGLKVSMLTFTAPHSAGDKVEDLVDKIKDALARFWRGKVISKLKNNLGYAGRITAFEIMYGDNGWHPHFHIIIFSKSALPSTLNDDGKPFTRKDFRHVKLENQSPEWRRILEIWQNSCRKAGLSEPNEYGLDIQDAENASLYITKFGSDNEILKTKSNGNDITWDVADELTKGLKKTGKKKSLSPWGLLNKIQESTNPKDRKKWQQLFIFYARALHGKNMLRWSNGTRKIFDLDEQETDEQILQKEIDKCDYLCDLTTREWRYILANNLRAIVKQVASVGDPIAIARLLFPLYSGSFDDYLSSFLSRKNGTSDISDIEGEWDLYQDNQRGEIFAHFDKIKPVTPVKDVKNYLLLDDESFIDDTFCDTPSLHDLHLERMLNRKIPKVLKIKSVIDWQFVDKCRDGTINEIEGKFEIV